MHLSMAARMLLLPSIFLLYMCLIHAFLGAAARAITTSGNETDRQALLAFKSRITRDPSGALRSWNETLHFCRWPGVSCSTPRTAPRRVTALDLSSKGLEGSLPPSIANLTALENLLLMNNVFSGAIPEELGGLQQLKLLNLSYNSLLGAIPANLSSCSQLTTLLLADNQLTGTIPPELGLMPRLRTLGLDHNHLVGSIPSSIANLSSLAEFSVMLNHLEGGIPEQLGELAKLEFFQVAGNSLSGRIPPQLFNLSSPYYFSAAGNLLHGSLPPTLGLTLPKIQLLYLGANQLLSGSIPPSLPNATTLEEFDIPENDFTGRIPSELGRLRNLIHFNVVTNRLHARSPDDWKFVDSLTNCSRLLRLFIGANELSGMLPRSIANLSVQLQGLRLGFSNITGDIPSGIGDYPNLMLLDSTNSLLTGVIPHSLGNLGNLLWLDLSANELTGGIPFSLGNLTQLTDLHLSNNNLQGTIPSSLGNLQQITSLDLSNNSLSGGIPKELVSLGSLSKIMDLSNNLLDGSLPSEVGRLKNLKQLVVSRNKLSGKIPDTLGNCEILEYLALDNNFFQGSIPPSLSNIKALQELDLSYNNFSGPIPQVLEDLSSLFYLNLSHNHLGGGVPLKGVFRNATAVSLSGNDGLCGGIPELNLAACPMKSPKRKRAHWPLFLKIVCPIAAVAMLLLLFAVFALIHRRKRPRKESTGTHSVDDLDRLPRVSYVELAKATDGFSSANLIGVGSYGSVYRGNLGGDGTIVAVKVFDLGRRGGASKSFLAECKALRSIRHRNLVKILTSCSSVDSKGNDFKALVFHFMPNGNLDKWLHHESHHLSLLQRLNVAVDVANALEYLHNNCHPPIVHCDLKPSKFLHKATGKSSHDWD